MCDGIWERNKKGTATRKEARPPVEETTNKNFLDPEIVERFLRKRLAEIKF